MPPRALEAEQLDEALQPLVAKRARGDLTDRATTGRQSDGYLFDIIKEGGAPIGRPGMPAFGAALKEEDIRELVAYMRGLARAR